MGAYGEPKSLRPNKGVNMDKTNPKKKRKYCKVVTIIPALFLAFLLTLSPCFGYFSDMISGRTEITLKVPLPQIQLIFPYNGGVQSYQVVYEGYYAIQAWGGNGGTGQNGSGGTGGKASGFVKLNAGDYLHVIVGGEGGAYNGTQAGGYSGGSGQNGGNGGTYGITNRGGGGGGATKIIVSQSNTVPDPMGPVLVMAVGAGGGGAGNLTPTRNGGDAGSAVPVGNGTNTVFNGKDAGSDTANGRGGTGTSGGMGGEALFGLNGDAGGYGYGGKAYSGSSGGGGGAGYYGGGGGAATTSGGGGGGSTFIAGYINSFATQPLSSLSPDVISSCPLNLSADRPDGNGYCIVTYLGRKIA